MSEIFLIKNRLHQQQLRLVEKAQKNSHDGDSVGGANIVDGTVGASENSEVGTSERKHDNAASSDDSCNAVDKKLGSDDEQQRRRANLFRGSDLSFNGKISPLIEGTGRVTNCALEDSTISSSYGFVQIKPKASGSYECDEAAQEKTLNETCELLTKENKSLTHYENEQSPDMFAEDDDTVDDKKKNDESLSRAYQRTSGMSSRELECVDESKVDRIERTLLKRLQMSLAGIPPPPALTYSAIDVGSMLAIYHSNAERWLAAHSLSKSDSARDGMEDKKAQECLSKPTQTLADLANIAWPELTKHRAHGLHYNRSLATEMFELLSLKYIERYLSVETSSSFNMTILQSSAKKRNQRLKLLSQSPGRRLSHLAKRRATFSSESLLSNSDSKCATSSSGRGIINANSLRKLNPHRVCNTRQVFLDPKKSDNRRKNKIKTPKRRTPGGKKSPHRRTPGSSSKSLTLRHVVTSSKPGTQPVHVPATRETSKRALFLSPQNGGVTASARAYGSNSKQTDRSIFSEARVLKSKRSLFSPTHESQSSIQPCSGASTFAGTAASSSLKTMSVSTAVSSNKRGRSPAVDNDNDERTEKIPRMESSGLSEEDLTPRSLQQLNYRAANWSNFKRIVSDNLDTGVPLTTMEDIDAAITSLVSSLRVAENSSVPRVAIKTR
ncbi:uncharacterized protein LOC128728989 [Anopheles nili]|uniref:uncharacterized protein LOC128728989 n=1 Tax=Anopheles nili TaxID=185578 RepID=UPI00237A4312|nr:uncharacterized protein LOC128728989 [Anopheles nili]